MILGVSTTFAKRFVFVGANLALVGFIGKLIKDNASRALPEDGGTNGIDKKLGSYMFWDAMFPHATEPLHSHVE